MIDPLDYVADRFHVDDNGCWLWNRRIANGYGRTGAALARRLGLSDRAHRFIYELTVEPIPAGLHLDHLCRVRNCVNPDHLEPVTPLENTRRGVGHGSETHCPQGHPYDEANTYIYLVNGRFRYRACRACGREAALARYHERKREQAA